jgi:hypothetical protein
VANTNLTIDMITREALRVLHQKCNFVGNISRQYDDSFANEGAKIGDTLRIRRPVKYTSATGATIATGTGADSTEQNFSLSVNTQRHIPLRFTSEELTLDIDNFSDRYIKPAMAQLAADIENDALSMVDNVYGWVDGGTKVSMANALSSRKSLMDYLAGPGPHTALLDTQANADLVDDLKGLFQDSELIAEQYREGLMGRTAGFDFYENTLLPNHTSGAEAGGTNYQTDVASQTSSDTKSMTLSIDTGSNTIAKGDVFTIAGVNRVHPESKVDSGESQLFVVIGGDTGTASATSITISPGIVNSGPRQNVSAAPGDNATLTFKGSASTNYKRSLFFAKDAFTFATADLIMPQGLDFASRQQYDGISMRILRDYAIVKDRMYTRCDVLYGYTPLYRQLASVIWHT